MRQIRFGVFLPFYAFRDANYHQLEQVVLDVEHLGYDAVWLDDHLMYGNWPILESWTTLTALAASTSRIRVGTLVNCNAHRQPALLAKAAATLDVLSEGRLELGIGAGCQEKEHQAYGFNFPSTKVRVEQMIEALEVIRRLWTSKSASFSGKHYSLKDAVCLPKPIQKPHPPITIGGSGENYTLRATAQYADRVDFGFLSSTEEYKRKLHVLERFCREAGRDFNSIERICWPSGQILLVQTQEEVEVLAAKSRPSGMPLEEYRQGTLIATPKQCQEHFKRFLDLGVTYFMLYFGDLPETRSLKLFAEQVIDNF